MIGVINRSLLCVLYFKLSITSVQESINSAVFHYYQIIILLRWKRDGSFCFIHSWQPIACNKIFPKILKYPIINTSTNKFFKFNIYDPNLNPNQVKVNSYKTVQTKLKAASFCFYTNSTWSKKQQHNKYKAHNKHALSFFRRFRVNAPLCGHFLASSSFVMKISREVHLGHYKYICGHK